METKTYTLDVSKWRCGGQYGNSNQRFHRLGYGDTELLNEFGYSCCLGQFALQDGFSEEEILHKSRPCDLNKPFYLFNEKLHEGSFGYIDTALAEKCISINDSAITTVQQKIDELRIVLDGNNINLNVINLP